MCQSLVWKERSMQALRYTRDPVGDTLTVWYGDPNTEYICEETEEEVILMKDASGTVIGKEILHVSSREAEALNIVFGETAMA